MRTFETRDEDERLPSEEDVPPMTSARAIDRNFAFLRALGLMGHGGARPEPETEFNALVLPGRRDVRGS